MGEGPGGKSGKKWGECVNRWPERDTLRKQLESGERQQKSGLGFPGGSVVKSPPARTGDISSTPNPGRSHM